MTRPETGRAQDAGGPGLQWPRASPGRVRAQRPRRGPARPPRSARGQPLDPLRAAPLPAAALLGLALLAAAPRAQAAKPVLRSTNPVTTSGLEVILHYDQSLEVTKKPINSRFTITVGGQTVAATGSTVTGSTYKLSLGFTIAPDEAVTIAYSKPTSATEGNPIQNSAGEEADSFSAKTATNSSTWSATALDASASETSIAGHGVVLSFTGALAASPAPNPPASAFTLTVDGTAQTPGARLYFADSGGSGKGLIALQPLPTAIKSGQTVQVSYAPPLGATSTVSSNRLFGSDAKLVRRFTTQTIANNTALVANTTKGTQSEMTFAFDQAQAFTTGSRAIRLDAARLRVYKGTGRDDPDYTVSIHSSNASAEPGDSLGTLTNPASLPETASSIRFEAPSGGIVLAAATTYFVVLDVTRDAANKQDFATVRLTDSDDEDDGKTTDWSIADTALNRVANVTTWGDDTSARSLVSGVHGAPVAPTLVSAAVNGTALTLTFNAKLDSSSVPPGSAFTVSGDVSATGTTTDLATATTVGVTLDSAVAHGQTVTVSYTKPASLPLKDTGTGTGALAALEVATFSGKTVKNETPEPATTFVSNTGQTAVAGSFIVGVVSGVNWRFAQSFTTGTNTAGYTLSAVDVELTSGTQSANTRVSIYSTSSGSPTGTPLHTLTNPSSLTASATNTFTAAASATLAANTTYAVVFEVTSGSATTSLAHTNSNAEDAGAASGWSIANQRRQKQGSAVWSVPSTSFLKPMIAIRGTAETGTPPPSTPTVSIARVGASVSEGNPAAFRVSASPAPASTLTVNLTVSQTGSFVSTGLGARTVMVPTSGSVDFSVATVDDSTDEVNGSVRATLVAGAGYTLHTTASQRTASVTVTDDDPTPPGQDPPQDPQDPSGETEQPEREPVPLQLALWTDKPGYRADETVRLYRTIAPHDDEARYRTFVYLERTDGEERRWLAPLGSAGELRDDPVDYRGTPLHLDAAGALVAADRALSWEGEAPEPGLWQFVLELRPGAPREQDAGLLERFDEPLRTRRAWARFAVAERSQLLNRQGFDREVRTDATLRSDTLYYLQHQLFVRDGATLTVEPGTILQAWGRNAAIIVEPGGRLVAEGTPEAVVVLTCSQPVGRREPGCWAGLRILGKAPVTRLEGVAPGVLPAGRPVYGGGDAEDSSGVLRYVRVEFAGAGGGEPQAAGPALGLYGAGSGTVLDHVQAHASLGDGFAFHGGTAECSHCVASASGHAGLSWERGWRGGASHLYVQHGSDGFDGLAGGNDDQGHDLEPRSLPALSNVTLVHGWPYGEREREGAALRLSAGSGVRVRDLLATRFGGAIAAGGRSRLLFEEGESSVTSALLWLGGVRPLRGGLRDAVEFAERDPKLRDVRDFANPDPRPKAGSPALPDDREGYIGAFGRKENWLEGWTVFGPESVYDLRERGDDEF